MKTNKISNKRLTLLSMLLCLAVFGLLFNANCTGGGTGLEYNINGEWKFVLSFSSSTVARSQYLTFTGTGLTGYVAIDGENVGVYIVEEDQSTASVLYYVTIIIKKEEIYTYTFTGKFTDKNNMSGSFTLVEEGKTSAGSWSGER